MTEPTHPDAPAADQPVDTIDAVHVADDLADDGVPMILTRAIAGLGERDEAVRVPADRAEGLHKAGFADYLSDNAARQLGIEVPTDAAPEFRTKTEAQDFAKVHDLVVDDSLRADDYKTAVAKAYADKVADRSS